MVAAPAIAASIGDYAGAYVGDSQVCWNSDIVLTENAITWGVCSHMPFTVIERDNNHLAIEITDGKCGYSIIKFERKAQDPSRGADVSRYKTRADYDRNRPSLLCWYSPAPR
jgi:hypothetical protein